MIKRIFVLLLLAAGMIQGAAGRSYKVADVENVQLADSNSYVSDPEGLLKPSTRDAVNRAFAELRRESSVEPALVVLPEIESDSPDDFATELFEQWGLGKTDKDNGLLFFVSMSPRRALLRPGYGLEGVLPDATCSRILRNELLPAFREGDYDSGVLAVVESLGEILESPEAVAEVRSALPDNRPGRRSEGEDVDFFRIYLYLSCIAALLMLGIFLLMYFSVKGQDRYDKYMKLEKLRAPYLAFCFLGLGVPLIATLPLVILLRHWRDGEHRCPNCAARMTKVDEVHDNEYLTPVQDLEEKIKSVDYDVWLCPVCNTTEVLPYVQRGTVFEECPKCHGRTLKFTNQHILKNPTTESEGVLQQEYECLNCHNHTLRRKKIAKLAPVVVVTPGLGGRGGGFSGGGGFGGGGFGGGHTGGGGAGVSW